MASSVTFEKEDGERVTVRLGQLPPSAFAKIAKETNAGLTYKGIEMFPKEDPDVLYAVICACAEFAGVEPPPKPDTMDADEMLREMVQPIDDIKDMPAVEGFLAEVTTTENGSSSGQLESSTGLEA